MKYKSISRDIAFLWLLFGIMVQISACASKAGTIQASTLPQNTKTMVIQRTESQVPSSTPSVAVETTEIAASTRTSDAKTVAALQIQPSWTSRPSATLSPTNTPIYPRPTVAPLKAHEWAPEPILIQMGGYGGDGCCYFGFPPSFILYSDGLFIMSNLVGRNFEYRPLFNRLERKEMCQLLNTIDQNGFFDYDPRVFQSPFAGAGSTYIQVDAWQSKYVNHGSLYYFIFGDYENEFENCDDCLPVILPEMENTFRLLVGYNPGGMKYYIPEQLLVWLLYPYSDETGKPWPLKSPSLADLLEERGSDYDRDPVAVDGDTVQDWFGVINNGVYYQGDLRVEIKARPMWPYETPGNYGPIIINPDSDAFPDTLNCKVVDGILPIPTE